MSRQGVTATTDTEEVIAARKEKARLLRRLWKIEDRWKLMQARKAAKAKARKRGRTSQRNNERSSNADVFMQINY